MDCCGMPMAVREGGGWMCRRCGECVGVPVVAPRNPFDVLVTEAPDAVPAAVVVGVNVVPVEPAAPAAVVSDVPRGTVRGRGGRK